MVASSLTRCASIDKRYAKAVQEIDKMAKAQIFTNNVKTIASALGQFNADKNLEQLIKFAIEIKPSNKVTTKTTFESPPIKEPVPSFNEQMQHTIQLTLQKLLHVGGLSEMLDLCNKLAPADVWIMHSHSLPTDKYINELVKKYSSTGI